MVSRELDVIHKIVNQNSFDEGFTCDNPGLARLSYVNIFRIVDLMVNAKIYRLRYIILISVFIQNITESSSKET